MVICLAETARVLIFSPKTKKGIGKTVSEKGQLTEFLWIKAALPPIVIRRRLSCRRKSFNVRESSFLSFTICGCLSLSFYLSFYPSIYLSFSFYLFLSIFLSIFLYPFIGKKVRRSRLFDTTWRNTVSGFFCVKLRTSSGRMSIYICFIAKIL